jgi:hypothetical protein
MRHSLAIAKNANGVLTCDQHGRIPRGLVPVGAADMSIPLQVLCVGALAEILSLSSLPDHTKKIPCALCPVFVLLPCANSFWVAPLIPTTAASWRLRSSCKIATE